MRTVTLVCCLMVLGACARELPVQHAGELASLDQGQLLELADVLARGGDTVRAQQYLLLAQKQGAPGREVLPRLMQLYVADGQYRLAIEHGEGYLRRFPSDTRLRQLLASLYVAVGDGAAAARNYEAVVQREPDNAHAHFALGALLHDQEAEHARVDAHYRVYLALEPRGEHAEEARAGLLEPVP